MIGYLRACGQNWIEMWPLNLGGPTLVFFMCRLTRLSWSDSFLAVAFLLVCLTFIPEAICRLAHGSDR